MQDDSSLYQNPIHYDDYLLLGAADGYGDGEHSEQVADARQARAGQGPGGRGHGQ